MRHARHEDIDDAAALAQENGPRPHQLAESVRFDLPSSLGSGAWLGPMAAQLGDYSGMIGFNFRGRFYWLEEFLEHHITETESLNKKSKDLYQIGRAHV